MCIPGVFSGVLPVPEMVASSVQRHALPEMVASSVTNLDYSSNHDCSIMFEVKRSVHLLITNHRSRHLSSNFCMTICITSF